MAKRNDFMEGFLRGLYNSGVGNPEVQRQNEQAQQTQNADFTSKMAGQGQIPNALPPDHPIAQKVGGFISQMFGGASSPRLTAANFKADPNGYYQDPTGEIGIGDKTPGSRFLPPAEGSKMMGEQYRATQDVWIPLPGVTGPTGKPLAFNKKTRETQEIPGATSAPGSKQDLEQDRLEQNARQMVANLRGDKSLARAEEQRDAAIVAYNRINEIDTRGGELNPIDYTDILGQIYKARTGSSPTEQVLGEIRQSTTKGEFGKAYTYITGQQAPATTQDIKNSLKDMASSMGQQADKFHEGYMKAHLIKPKNLSDDRWEPIFKTNRGVSFQEATGYQSDNSAKEFKTLLEAQAAKLPKGTRIKVGGRMATVQ